MADDSWRIPTLVQELATAVLEPPRRYVQREQDRPGSLLATDLPEPIPVIDISRLSDNAAEADKLHAALRSWGFVLVTNHGIEASLMDDLMNAAREFFHQPLEVKRKYSNLVLDSKQCHPEGYGNDEVLTQDQILDWSDRLQLTLEPEDERNLAFWPKHPESFRDVLHEYASKTKKISNRIFQAMARLLELDQDYFISQISDKPHTLARFNYYPPCPRPDLVNGVSPHSDGGVLTILLVDKEVGGLQVQRDGTWYNFPSKPHTLLINLGDCMEIMTNGIFKSPVHRVVTNAEKERISLALFYAMDGDKVLEPAAGLLGDKRLARFRAIKVKDLIAGYQEHFARGTRFIESLGI